MKRKTKYLILGLVFLIPFLFFLMATIAYATDLNRWGVAVFSFALVLTILLGAPAFAFFARRRREVQRERKGGNMVALLKSYGRVSLRELAKRMDQPEAEVEFTLMEAIAGGEVTGFIDPDTRTFYYGTSAPEYQPVVTETKVVEVPIRVPAPPDRPKDEVRYCRECGQRVEWVAEEGRWHCPNCGNYQA